MGYTIKAGTTQQPSEGGAYDTPTITSSQSSYANLAAASAAEAVISAEQAAASATSAATSATSAEASATLASQIASVGLGGALGYDFGYVSDPFALFPTDLGSV